MTEIETFDSLYQIYHINTHFAPVYLAKQRNLHNIYSEIIFCNCLFLRQHFRFTLLHLR